MLKKEQKINKKDIAIIGMSGRFPKSANLKAFWENLIQGKELINHLSEEELLEAGTAPENINNQNYIRAESRISQYESFDYSFFGYTKSEALMMDPQVRIMHEQTWLALEDAGYIPSEYTGKIGLYLAASDNLFWRLHSMTNRHPKVNPVLQNYISDRKHLSTLISYNLDLKGPSFFMDTTCSSSMVTIHTACRNLLFRECSMAVAGGVRVSSNTELGYFYEKGMINSQDGHCKVFDASASGTISGEGAGLVVLKRLEDAVNDKDHIYAVVKASAINNDGKTKVGFTAPSVAGQADCIRLAHRIAGIKSSSIDFIEAHGTGTRLGDPIEIEALNEAFKGCPSDYSCPIGSVKSNIGHLDTGAGVAGFLKTTLALKNKQLPPSLHFVNANPEINFNEGPFYVNTQLQDLKKTDDNPLRAGLSSFGIGGTNVHAILESYDFEQEENKPRPFQLLAFSAKTPEGVNHYQEKIHDFIKETPSLNLGNTAYSFLTSRKGFKYRSFIVCQDIKDGENQLGSPLPVLKTLNRPKVVFMFPGQGSQYFEMGKNLYDDYPYYKDIIDQGVAILKEETGEDYHQILGYKQNVTSDLQQINQTVYTQPAIFLVEYALAKLLIRWGIEPHQMIGHSLGEYVAACISGVFSFANGLRLIQRRGDLMNRMHIGNMLSVGMNEQALTPLLSEGVSIAAINNDTSCVVAGDKKYIDELIEKLEEKNIAYSILKTSHAFHSKMMEPILDSFQEVLKKVTLNPPSIPFISNLTGKEITGKEAISPLYWSRHLRETVRFKEGLSTLLQLKNIVCVEVGPGKVLSTFLRQHPAAENSEYTINILRHPKKEVHDSSILLNALGGLWSLGLPVNWAKYFEAEQSHKIAVPNYPFQVTKLTTRVNPLSAIKGGSNLQVLHKDILNDMEAETEVLEFKKRERPTIETEYTLPNTDLQKQLCQLWSSYLGIEEVGIEDDFFQLGGDSLKGMSLLKIIHDRFGVELSIHDLYQKTTILEIEQEIELAQRLAKMQKVASGKNRIKI